MASCGHTDKYIDWSSGSLVYRCSRCGEDVTAEVAAAQQQATSSGGGGSQDMAPTDLDYKDVRRHGICGYDAFYSPISQKYYCGNCRVLFGRK
jgi:hypothetical protein